MIDKPKGITSHDVVDVVRRGYDERRVGHAGTLDPNATGLLIVGVGRESTKKLGSITKDTDKTYEAEIFLGETRDTDDSEGKIISKSTKFTPPPRDIVNRVIKEFIGKQEQLPPIYSAIKMNGKKAYELARKGLNLKLNTRNIVVHSIKLNIYMYPILTLTCKVSSGTYIRSLARDIGAKLGCGGYLKELRRTQIGEFSVEKAISLQELPQRTR
ncbi:MAG: tRNA pseudouridine(55) synthase TruB [Patescibacteria group bacterium]